MAHGRGSWNTAGSGGTKAYKNEDRPGPYYYLGTGYPPAHKRNVDEHAVYWAVIAYQNALNSALGVHLTIDGHFGPVTSSVVTTFQEQNEKVTGTPWGGIGPETSKALLLPFAKAAVQHAENPKVNLNMVTGTVKQESKWDAGSVGYLDPHDLGLAQINGPAHPGFSPNARLTPAIAFAFVVAYYDNSLSQLHNNVRDAVASYNLGIGGARSWIRAGRPDEWQPSPSSSVRHVKAYIDNILRG